MNFSSIINFFSNTKNVTLNPGDIIHLEGISRNQKIDGLYNRSGTPIKYNQYSFTIPQGYKLKIENATAFLVPMDKTNIQLPKPDETKSCNSVS